MALEELRIALIEQFSTRAAVGASREAGRYPGPDSVVARLTIADVRATMIEITTSGRGRMILINVTMSIRPDKMDEWLALADAYAKDVNSEDGCLFFQFSRSLTNENEFVCIEGFTDAKAGASHVEQTHVKRFFEVAPDLVSAQPMIIYIDTPHEGFGPMGEIQPR